MTNKTKEETDTIGLVVCAVVSVLIYIYFLSPLASSMGYGTFPAIIISVIIFFVSYGKWTQTKNQNKFYVKSKKKLS
jgi:hypothetical protein